MRISDWSSDGCPSDLGVVVDRVIAARDLVVARARDTGDALAEVDPRRKLVDQPGLEIGLRDVAARRGDDLRGLGEKRRDLRLGPRLLHRLLPLVEDRAVKRAIGLGRPGRFVGAGIGLNRKSTRLNSR